MAISAIKTGIIKMNIKKSTHKYYEVCWHELPTKAQEQFDYCTDKDACNFIKYKGYWYDISEFQRITDIQGFDYGQADSYFSGVLLKYNYDEDCYTMATYYT